MADSKVDFHGRNEKSAGFTAQASGLLSRATTLQSRRPTTGEILAYF